MQILTSRSGVELRICIPHKFLGNADTVPPQTTLWIVMGWLVLNSSIRPANLPCKISSARLLLKPGSGEKQATRTNTLPGWLAGLTHWSQERLGFSEGPLLTIQSPSVIPLPIPLSSIIALCYVFPFLTMIWKSYFSCLLSYSSLGKRAYLGLFIAVSL